ncbi:LysR family transcriptional regulator [Rhodovulum sp. DZ06]|uniref:LysR family transcriptional regulator n=1 Tax=Rhodovulum sp. DZ06 TaxID=3425126 RepID=UPI003D3572C8
MDLRQLRYFLAITEEGAVSRAAARLGVAQPALSAHVRRMEEELGAQLLLRSSTGVVPTEAGALLAERARALLLDFERMEEEVRGLGAAPGGLVRIGLPGTIADMTAAPLIARTRARYPGIRLQLAEAMSGFVAEWLRDGRVDLAVLYLDAAAARRMGVRLTPLLDEELVALAPPGAEAGELDGVAPLAEAPLVLPSGAHGLRAMLDRVARAEGVQLAPQIEIDSYSNIKRLVAEGHGVSVLPWRAVAEEERDGRLVVRRFGGERLRRRASLAEAAGRPATRAAQAAAGLLREVVEESVAAGLWAGATRVAEG